MVEEVLRKIKSLNKEKAWIVGGYTRSKFTLESVNDIDIITDKPENFINSILDIIDPGSLIREASHHGTTIFKISGIHIEVSQGNPSDYTRRDFSMNSIYQDLETDEILDPSGLGISDIKNQIIRMPSDFKTYEEVIQSDPVKILRGVRFSSQTGWGIDKLTRRVFKQCFYLIPLKVHREMITSELKKIILSNYPVIGIETLRELGILSVILPGVQKLRGVIQGKQHFGDVYDHTLRCFELTCQKTSEFIPRMAALLHDIGKPKTRTEKDGVPHFYKHELIGSDMIPGILSNGIVRFSNQEILEIQFLVRYHMDTKSWGDRLEKLKDKYYTARKFLYKIRNHYENLMILIDADNNSHSPEYCMPNQVQEIKNLGVEDIMGYYLPVTGEDIMRIKNIPGGPEIEKYKEILLNRVFKNPNLTKTELEKLL